MSTGNAEASENNIRVFVRIRPPSDEEPAYSRVVEVNEAQIVLKQGQNPRVFSFDYVADTKIRQETIFNNLGKEVIENCIAGYNGTIFAYGQTGSGKTYTMLGPTEDADSFEDELRGVIPRSLEYLFCLIRREKELHGENKEFLCKCSFLEIYNEQIFDLLEPSPQVLHLRESLKTGVYVSGLAEQIVTDASEAYQVLNSSWMNRRVASTSMNRESSRSHAVFTLNIESKEIKGGAETIKTSQLNLVDLAGSESQKNTNATGVRLKEAGSINKSLSNLGNVIMSLVNVSRDKKERHIPYRDSKLTFLLRASFGGNSKTSLVACIHSGHKFYAETLSTLQFAKRAKMIKNKAILNENAQCNVQQLQLEIKALKDMLSQYKSGGVVPSADPQEPAEPVPVLKKMFLKAMRLYQKAEMDKMELENEITEQRKKADKTIRQKVMIIKFREDAIKRHEDKKKGIVAENPDQTVELLKEEIKLLKEEIDHHPLVTKYSSDLQKLRKEVQRIKSCDDWLAKVDTDHTIVKDLEQMYKQLIAEQKASEDEPLSVPQNTEMVSTMEKLMSEKKDVVSENNMLKQSLKDTKEELEEKVKEFAKAKEFYNQSYEKLHTVIAANETRNQMEKAHLTEKHLQTVITITTPSKERKRRSSRTISHTDSPLDTTIPFEKDDAEEDGIMGEEAPQEMVELANKAFCEQIKQQQDTISNLEMRITEFDKDRIQEEQKVSMLQAQLSQMQEQLKNERAKEHTARQQLTGLECSMKEKEETTARNNEELEDLRLVLKSADNELKDWKKKCKTLEASIESGTDTITSLRQSYESKIQQTTKEKEAVLSLNEKLRNDLDVKETTLTFKEDLCTKLEDAIKEKEAEISQLDSKLQGVKSHGEITAQMYGEQCAANDKLHSELADLKQQVKKSNESLEHQKKVSEQTKEKINQLYARIQKEVNEKEEHQQMSINLREEVATMKICEEVNLVETEKLKQTLEEALLEKQRQEVKYDLLEDDLGSALAECSKVTEERDALSKQQESLEDTKMTLEKENTVLNEKITQMRETANLEQSSNKSKYQDASLEIIQLTAQLLDSEDSFKLEQSKLCRLTQRDAILKEKEDAVKNIKDLAYQNEEFKERIKNQDEKIAALNDTLSQSKNKTVNMRFDHDQLKKELNIANEELASINRSIQEKEELESKVTRLTEIAKKDNDEKLTLNASLEAHRNGMRKIQSLLDDGQDAELCDLDYIYGRSKLLKEEYNKLLEENSILVGHSNTKQKIKFHEQVKLENNQLKKELAAYKARYKPMDHNGRLPHEEDAHISV